MVIVAPLKDHFGLLGYSSGLIFRVPGISCISNNKVLKLISEIWNCSDIPENSQMGKEISGTMVNDRPRFEQTDRFAQLSPENESKLHKTDCK